MDRLLPEHLLSEPPVERVTQTRADRSSAAFKVTQRVSQEEVVAYLRERESRRSQRETLDEPVFPLVGGRYEVVDEIGEGGMSRILKVRHKGLGREFALKMVQSSAKMADRLREHLLREARMVSRLEHPNIVQVTDFDVDPEWGVFIVMEYLKGETLFDRLRREGRFGVPLALQIALQVTEAVIYMHERRIVHRDLKLENVFLVRPPRQRRQIPQVKLIDFGLSGVDLGVTLRGSSGSVGTPAYMSPEQLRGEAPRPAMDIYALGVLIYEMLTGSAPFEGSLDEVVSGHLNDPPVPPSARLGAPLDERLEALVLRALAKTPAERQGSAAALAYEIRTVMDMLGVKREGRRRRGREEAPPAPECLDADALRGGWMAFANAPTPLFQLTRECLVLEVNDAAVEFLHRKRDLLVGKSLADTALGRVHPKLAEDVSRCVESQVPVQRGLAIPTDPVSHIALSLAPAVDPDDASQPNTVVGVIFPLQRPQSS